MNQWSRRRLLGTCAAVGATLALPALGEEAFSHSTIHKAIIVGKVTEAELTRLKEAGFEGVETTNICPDAEAAAGAALAKGMGMRVHSVLRGWAQFASEDPKVVEESLEVTRKALRAAHAYGADTILLVPSVSPKCAMPQPWEYEIEFDEKTGHVSRVAKRADNDKYAEYIAAQNRATDTGRLAVEKLLPLAEEMKIIIGLENVWNNLWVEPKLYRNFVASFNSPWAKAYFDIGNVVKYSPPEKWIKVLDRLIVKLHVKDYRLVPPDNHSGGFVHPRDGSINWPAVRKALDDAKYDGWASIEDGGLPFKEFGRRFNLIIEGK
jgi:L-ribulose-5-phosphate 3-epimerase